MEFLKKYRKKQDITYPWVQGQYKCPCWLELKEFDLGVECCHPKEKYIRICANEICEYGKKLREKWDPRVENIGKNVMKLISEEGIQRLSRLLYDSEEEILFRKDDHFTWNQVNEKHKSDCVAVMRRFLIKIQEDFDNGKERVYRKVGNSIS